MYAVYEVEEWVGVPPDRVYRDDVDLDKEALEILRASLEAKYIEGIGFIVAVLDARVVGDGVVLSLGTDPNIYYPVRYRVLSFEPVRGEIVKGTVVRVDRASLTVNLGPMDGRVPRDQIMDEQVEIMPGVARGANSGREIREGDVVRARVMHVSRPGRHSSFIMVTLTMRQPYLGKEEWVEAQAAQG